jgi:hypothetical protein
MQVRQRALYRCAMTDFSIAETRAFFAQSEVLDYFVLRPLAHIRANWDVSWDASAHRYESEEDSFAEQLNVLIDDIATCEPPAAYHDHEDRLAERCRDKMKWPISKKDKRWVGVKDYHAILENGTIPCYDQEDLVLAAAGRVKAAMLRGQMHFDSMEESHRYILGGVMAIIIYQRADF